MSLRELRHSTSEVLARVRHGETIDVTEYGRLVARIVPVGEREQGQLGAAANRAGPRRQPGASRGPAGSPGLLAAFSYVSIDDEVVEAAMNEPDRMLRSRDAIHLATARVLGPDLTGFATYDDRLAAAARDAGMPVIDHATDRPCGGRDDRAGLGVTTHWPAGA